MLLLLLILFVVLIFKGLLPLELVLRLKDYQIISFWIIQYFILFFNSDLLTKQTGKIIEILKGNLKTSRGKENSNFKGIRIKFLIFNQDSRNRI